MVDGKGSSDGNTDPSSALSKSIEPVSAEVKLSEPDFNPCSAWLSPRNDRLDVCATSGPFGNNSGACFPAPQP